MKSPIGKILQLRFAYGAGTNRYFFKAKVLKCAIIDKLFYYLKIIALWNL